MTSTEPVRSAAIRVDASRMYLKTSRSVAGFPPQ